MTPMSQGITSPHLCCHCSPLTLRLWSQTRMGWRPPSPQLSSEAAWRTRHGLWNSWPGGKARFCRFLRVRP